MDKKLRNMTSLYLVSNKGILCLYRIGSRVANNKYVGAAGGHFEETELNDPRKCVLREAKEELGLEAHDLTDLRLRYITHRLVGNEIRQNYYFFAGLETDKNLNNTEGNLRWVSLDEIDTLDMPVSAKHMLQHYIKVGRFTECLYGGITEENRTNFVIMKDFAL